MFEHGGNSAPFRRRWESFPCNDFAWARRRVARFRKGARYFYLHETKGGRHGAGIRRGKGKG